MERGAWWAMVHGIAESDMTEKLTFSLEQLMKRYKLVTLFLFCILYGLFLYFILQFLRP